MAKAMIALYRIEYLKYDWLQEHKLNCLLLEGSKLLLARFKRLEICC